MSNSDDYFSDMPEFVINDNDAEQLLQRDPDVHPHLDELATALEALNPDHLDFDVDSRAGRFSLRASALVREGSPKAAGGFLTRLVPRFGPVLVAVLVLAGATGLATTANASVPGDFLYGLDQAMEKVGVYNGGIDERLAEAEVLAERGETSEALDHLANSLPEDAGPASEALLRAAERLSTSGSSFVHPSLSEMLEWMATTDAEGREFGQGVAERARELGQGNGNRPENPGNGNGPPAEPPGRSGK